MRYVANTYNISSIQIHSAGKTTPHGLSTYLLFLRTGGLSPFSPTDKMLNHSPNPLQCEVRHTKSHSIRACNTTSPIAFGRASPMTFGHATRSPIPFGHCKSHSIWARKPRSIRACNTTCPIALGRAIQVPLHVACNTKSRSNWACIQSPMTFGHAIQSPITFGHAKLQVP